ncbi:hypothetical protein [Roseimaritima ulvae]|uniref:Uncharacterized protein n=1 Tax=Roseimaritima ulvae TaxID=980254 RepID=A0A5B9QRD3_9BACT|nr:hypothetical protein [Roseimaritima ulvae]QEG40469.1 hypothetical protein UC8_24810 [Roseimaritima ulvae]
MKFAKMFTVLLVAILVGFAFGQPPAAPKESTTLDSLHDQRIEVYSKLLEVAHARGSSGQQQRRKLLLVKIDGAKTPKERVVLAEELLEVCRQYEHTLRTGVRGDIETLLKAKAERIEAEILVKQLASNG